MTLKINAYLSAICMCSNFALCKITVYTPFSHNDIISKYVNSVNLNIDDSCPKCKYYIYCDCIIDTLTYYDFKLNYSNHIKIKLIKTTIHTPCYPYVNNNDTYMDIFDQNQPKYKSRIEILTNQFYNNLNISYNFYL